ncbi:hypothetical protein J7L13_02940 [bacterium]|nr:hypothetical protein [bacterium]
MKVIEEKDVQRIVFEVWEKSIAGSSATEKDLLTALRSHPDLSSLPEERFHALVQRALGGLIAQGAIKKEGELLFLQVEGPIPSPIDPEPIMIIKEEIGRCEQKLQELERVRRNLTLWKTALLEALQILEEAQAKLRE